METVKPFLTAFLQVMFVVANTVMIATQNVYGIASCSFLISLLWTFNVKAALGNWAQRLSYCAGATIGGVTGSYIAHLI